MEFVSVFVAAVASFAWGAVWYSTMANPWMAAAGITKEEVNQRDPKPFIIGFVGSILVAGMMRHIFASSGVSGIGEGALSGAGLGAFIALPWLATCYGFSNRPMALTVIDGTYTIVGATIMGIVLTLL